MKSTFLSTHDQASSALGLLGSVKEFFTSLCDRCRGRKKQAPEDDEEESLLSSSTWSSESDKDIRKRVLLQKRSWGVQDPEMLDQENNEDKQNEAYLLLLLCRFLSGVALTQGFYMLLTYHSQWDPKSAAFWTGSIGFVVATGMAFVKVVRCIVALLLPSFCTGKGRSIIMAFCLMMLMTGPTVNIAHNYRQMSRSLTCGDELGYNVSQGLRALVHEGQNSVLATMDDTVDSIVEAVEEAEEMYHAFASKLQSVADVVKTLNRFIHSMGDICNDRLGSFLCIIPSFVAKQANKLITDPLKNAIALVKSEFAFNMSYSHEFHYDINTSKSVGEISDAIMREVQAEISDVTDAFEWVRFAMGFSAVFVVLKAMKYWNKYLTSNEFDNCYITDKFIKLDKRRKRQGKIAVLPLRAKENSKYVSPNRIWMSRSELKKFAKGFSFLTFNFFYTLVVITVDYGFWRLLTTVSLSLTLRKQAGSMVNQIVEKSVSSITEAVGLGEAGSEAAQQLLSLVVGGAGFVSLIYKSIASALERLASSEGYSFGIDKCLPKARAPDFHIYVFLLALYLLLYVICIIEPYMLRSRRRIMATFYPKRERTRILFLRAKILSQRGLGAGGGLIQTGLKQACLKMQQNKEEEEVSLLAKLANRSGVLGWFARILSGRNQYRCDVCKLAGGTQHRNLFQPCGTFGCKAIYCIECYEDLHRLCLICLMKQSRRINRERRKSRRGLPNQTVSANEYNALAEELLESSGISDSSASSSDEETDEPRKAKKKVRFGLEKSNDIEMSRVPLADSRETSSDDDDNASARRWPADNEPTTSDDSITGTPNRARSSDSDDSTGV